MVTLGELMMILDRIVGRSLLWDGKQTQSVLMAIAKAASPCVSVTCQSE